MSISRSSIPAGAGGGRRNTPNGFLFLTRSSTRTLGSGSARTKSSNTRTFTRTKLREAAVDHPRRDPLLLPRLPGRLPLRAVPRPRARLRPLRLRRVPLLPPHRRDPHLHLPGRLPLRAVLRRLHRVPRLPGRHPLRAVLRHPRRLRQPRAAEDPRPLAHRHPVRRLRARHRHGVIRTRFSTRTS